VFVELDRRQARRRAPSPGQVRAVNTQARHGMARRSAQTSFGEATGLVAVTVGCLALSAYMGRDLTGGAAIALSIHAVMCRVGLNSASPDGHPLVMTTLRFGLGRRARLPGTLGSA
jgi:hypothetical protein